MLRHYNATVTFDRPLSDPRSEQFAETTIDRLIHYSPAVGADASGRTEVIITLPGETLAQAVTTTIALLARLPTEPTPHSIEVLPTADFDIRNGIAPTPELVSITEAAALLDVSRQAVQQRIRSGRLPAHKIGTTWAIPRSNLPH